MNTEFYQETYKEYSREELIHKISLLEMKVNRMQYDGRSIDSKLLNVPTGKTLNDLETCREIIVENPSNTLESDLETLSDKLGTHLNDPEYIYGKVMNRVAELNPTINNLEEAITAVSDVVSDSTSDVLSKINSCILSIKEGGTVLQDEIDTLSTKIGTYTPHVDINTDVTNNLTKLKTDASSIKDAIDSIDSVVFKPEENPGTTYYRLTSRVSEIDNTYDSTDLKTATDVVRNKLGTSEISLIQDATVLLTSIGTNEISINSALGTPVTSFASMLDSTTDNIRTRLNSISTVLDNTTDFTDSLKDKSEDILTQLNDDTTTVTKDFTVILPFNQDINIYSGKLTVTLNDGSNDLIYSYHSNTVLLSGYNGYFYLNDDINADVILFKNVTQGDFNSLQGIGNYLNSRFPVGTKITCNIKNTISGAINYLIGGTETSTKSKLLEIKSKIGSTSISLDDKLGDPVTTLSNMLHSDNLSSLKSCIDEVCIKIYGSSEYTDSIATRLTSIIDSIDNTVESSTVKNLTVSYPAIIYNGDTNVYISLNNGSQNCTYRTTWTQDIQNGQSITLLFSGETVVLKNIGTTLSSNTDIATYLNKYYKVGSTINRNLYNNVISTLTQMLGSSGDSVRVKLFNICESIRLSPTYVVGDDITYIKDLIGGSNTLEDRVNSVLLSLGGSGTIINRINGDGGISSKLGGTVTCTSVSVGYKTSNNIIFLDDSLLDFNNASTVDGKLAAFLSLFNPANVDSLSSNKFTFDLTIGYAPTSLADLISKILIVE